MQEESKNTEEFSISGDKLVEKFEEIVRAGNVRRIIIKRPIHSEDGLSDKEVVEFSLTAGIIVTALAPVLVALAAVAVLAAEWTIVVERRD